MDVPIRRFPMEGSARDLVLLDRCLSKLTFETESNEQLETTVASILGAVLNKLASPDVAVKHKAIEVLTTVQRLVRDNKHVSLPLDDILDSYRANASSRGMALVFLNLALDRTEGVVKLLPKLLVGIADINAKLRDNFLRTLLDYVHLLPSSRDVFLDPDWKDFVKRDKDVDVMLAWAFKVLVFPAVTEEERASLTADGKRLLDWGHNGELLGKTKDGFLRLFDNVELFSNEQIYSHLLLGMGDVNTLAQERSATALTRRRVDRDSVAIVSDAVALLERSAPPVPFGVRDVVLAQLCKAQAVSRPPLLPRVLKLALGTLFGENERLKGRSIQLLRWMLLHIEPAHLSPFAGGLVAGLLQLVARQLVIPATDSLRAGAYAVIGAVIRQCSTPFKASLAIPDALVSSLAREQTQSSTRDALRSALFEMAPAFADWTDEAAMVEFLRKLASSSSPEVRSVAGRWAKETLPFSCARARSVALSLTEDEHLSVSREAKQALNDTKHYPSFVEMLAAVNEETPTNLTEPPLWHGGAIRFLWRCLPDASALLGMPQAVQIAWDRLLWTAMESGRVTSSLPATACQHLVWTVSVDPLRVLETTRQSWIDTRWAAVAFNAYAGPIRSDGRPLYATLASMVHAALSPLDAGSLLASVDETIEALKDLASGKTSAPVERLAAAIHFLGLLVSVHPRAGTVAPPIWDLLLSVFDASKDTVISSACIEALSQLSRRIPGLSVAAGLDKACSVLTGLVAKSERLVAEEAVYWIGALALGNNLTAEQKTTAVDAIFEACPPSSHSEISWVSGETLSILFLGWNAPDCAFGGDFANWKWFDINKSSQETPEIIKPTLLRMYQHPMASGNVRQRECVAVWLCSLLRFAPKAVTPYLEHMVQAMSILLADPSSLTRECASRGLLYAWNVGGEEDKSLLLAGLVRDFSTGTGSKQKFDREVFPDDALRNPKTKAAAPATGPGSSSATASGGSAAAAEGDGKEAFRQIAGVAKDVDSNLTPSLMSLASDPSVWTGGGRAAAFSSDDNRLIRAARSQLLPSLPKIFPTLWRGQYWPEVYVARSFRRVLRTLSTPDEADEEAKDNTALEPASKRPKGVELGMSDLLTLYFDATFDLIVKSGKDRDWSAREAALSSLGDLLSGRSWHETEENFADVWKMVLMGMDDMRESVREAAAHASSALGNITSRFVDPAHSPLAEASLALGIVVTQLLEYGVSSPAKEVQGKAVGMLKTVVKASRSAIEPHVADILEKLLHCASALEPEMISYLAQHTDKVEMSKEDLHRARATMSRMTPLGECVDECLKYVGPDNILQVVKSIESGLKGAGLPTLLQSSWAVTSLSRGTGLEVLKGKPATSLTLSLLQVLERHQNNSSAYKELCTAVASIGSYASSKLWSKRILPLVNNGYFVSGQDDQRFQAGLMLNALCKDNRSNEVLRSCIGDCIAVTFVGKHDSEKRVRAEFSEVFVGIGAPSAVSLYNQDILAAIRSGTLSSNWSVRRQCYRALAVVAPSLSEGLEPVIEMLIAEGKTPKHWKGKGSLLRALSTMLSVAMPRNAPGLDELILQSVEMLAGEIVRKGATRPAKYKSSAAKAMLSVVREASLVLTTDRKCDMWLRLWPSPLQSLLLGHGGDKDYLALHEAGFFAIAHAFMDDTKEEGVLDTIMHGIARQSASEVRVAAISALAKLIVEKKAVAWTEAQVHTVTGLILFCLADKFVAVRERISALILSQSFEVFPPLTGALMADIGKVTAHQESRSAIEKLKVRK